MKQTLDEHRFFYVDETGDPNFYAKGKKLIVGTEGCSRTFGVGFLRTSSPDAIRDGLSELRVQLAADRYLANIPSMRKTAIAFHAKDDCPEVRKAVFEALDKADFSVQIVIARKLARRGDKAKQHALRSAVGAGIAAFRHKYPASVQTTVDVQTAYAAQEPLLQAADYALWAVQRAFERGEMRYFGYLSGKIEVIWDIYDFAKIKAGEPVIYTRRNNPFDVSKVSPLS